MQSPGPPLSHVLALIEHNMHICGRLNSIARSSGEGAELHCRGPVERTEHRFTHWVGLEREGANETEQLSPKGAVGECGGPAAWPLAFPLPLEIHTEGQASLTMQGWGVEDRCWKDARDEVYRLCSRFGGETRGLAAKLRSMKCLAACSPSFSFVTSLVSKRIYTKFWLLSAHRPL
jgi:hypothetical protein